jgi:hypothetical protein
LVHVADFVDEGGGFDGYQLWGRSAEEERL